MKKRILKRIGFSLVILSSLLLGTACLNPSNAQDVLFYKSTEHIGMGYIFEHFGWDGGFILLLSACAVTVVLMLFCKENRS